MVMVARSMQPRSELAKSIGLGCKRRMHQRRPQKAAQGAGRATRGLPSAITSCARKIIPEACEPASDLRHPQRWRHMAVRPDDRIAVRMSELLGDGDQRCSGLHQLAGVGVPEAVEAELQRKPRSSHSKPEIVAVCATPRPTVVTSEYRGCPSTRLRKNSMPSSGRNTYRSRRVFCGRM
jgi:hypothetical protein